MLLKELEKYEGENRLINMFNELSYKELIILICNTPKKRLKILSDMLPKDETELLSILKNTKCPPEKKIILIELIIKIDVDGLYEKWVENHSKVI